MKKPMQDRLKQHAGKIASWLGKIVTALLALYGLLQLWQDYAAPIVHPTPTPHYEELEQLRYSFDKITSAQWEAFDAHDPTLLSLGVLWCEDGYEEAKKRIEEQGWCPLDIQQVEINPVDDTHVEVHTVEIWTKGPCPPSGERTRTVTKEGRYLLQKINDQWCVFDLDLFDIGRTP